MTTYHEDFKLKADDKCRLLHKTVSDLSKHLPKVRKRLQDEMDNRDSLQRRLEKLQELSIESLSGDVLSFEKFKASMKKLNVELAVSEEVVRNLETSILPNAEARLRDSEQNLKIVLEQLIHETRPIADAKINEFLRSCVNERENFLDAWRAIYNDFGLHLIVSDEAICPGIWATDEIRDLRLRLGMTESTEPTFKEVWRNYSSSSDAPPTPIAPPTPSVPIEGIYGVPEAAQSDDNIPGDNYAAQNDDIFEQEDSEISLDVS